MSVDRTRRWPSACALVLVLASAAACLDPNTDFDGPVSTTGAADTVAESSSTEASSAESSSAETSMVCEGDGFDNVDMEATLVLGSHTAVLETPETRNRFNLYLMADDPEELYIAADVNVHVCAFIECTNSVEPSVPSCIAPATSGASEEGQPGCCGYSGMGLTYACDVDMGAKFHIVIAEAPADCTHYGFEVATSPL